MATFAGQPFQFQNVKEEDVFPDSGFWTAGLHPEPDDQELPRKLIAEKVITNNMIHDWVSYQAPPLLTALVCVNQSPGGSTSHRFREMIKACIDASSTGFQQKPFGEVVTYVKRAAEMIHQATVDKAAGFPYIGQYFTEREVVKHGIAESLVYIEDDKRGVRFNLSASAASTVQTFQFFNEAFVANNQEVLSEEAFNVQERVWYTFFQE